MNTVVSEPATVRAFLWLMSGCSSILKYIDVYSSGPWTYHPAGLTARSDVDTDIATQTVAQSVYPTKYSVRPYSGNLGAGGAVVALGGFTTMVLGRP